MRKCRWCRAGVHADCINVIRRQMGNPNPSCFCVCPEKLPKPRARRGDPETSHWAAEGITGLRESLQAVWWVLAKYGPAVDYDLVRYYVEAMAENDIPMQAESGIRTRRDELVKLGYVRWTGRWSPHPETGNDCRVWEAVLR